MRLSLLRLPTLLLSCLIFAAAALPVESVELTVLNIDSFETTVSKGVWLIEHFSPYCVHCRNFMPTWEQLVAENQKTADPGIRLAQVNCAVSGDLCNKNKVDGYPQIDLYKDGKYVKTFKGSRDFDRVNKFIQDNAEPKAPAAISAPPADVPSSTPENGLAKADPNPLGLVTSLDETTFQKVTEEGGVFVKFFAPWCGHCKKLAPVWTQLGLVMQNKLTIAEVNCEEHSALCRKEGVQGYPMLFYYASKGTKTEYTGGRKIEQLKAFGDKVSGPGVTQVTAREFEERVAEHPVLYLVLHSAKDTVLFNQIVQASHVLFGSPPLFVATADTLFGQFHVTLGTAAILAFKDHDSSTPTSMFTLMRPINAESERTALVDWLLRNRLPTTVELDQDNFQDIMSAPHKPLVVLTAATKKDIPAASKSVQELGRQWRDSHPGEHGERDVVFAWMDAERWTSWLKSMYGVKAEDGPKVVVTDHSRLVYYDQDQFGEKIELTSKSVFSAVSGALHGTIKAKHSENIIERMARYLNAKLVAVEQYVTENPWHTAAFGIAIVVAIIVGLKRLFADPDDWREQEALRKSNRLD